MTGGGLPTQGQRFGAYQLHDQLGRGGMGVVYRAEHVHLGRTVALKVLAPELSGNGDFRDRFLRESRLAATLDHPNVVTVYDAGDVDGALYLAMRLVNGEDLSRLLAACGALDPEEAVSRLEQVASALDTAHRAGLVHRDVKPQNVLIEGERSYLTDFGLTKPTTQSDMTAMTATGVFLGTPDYAAPEQITGSAVDARTDVYALAAVLHECVTGSRLFARDSQVAVLYAHLHEPPPRPSEVRAGLPPALDAVVARGLAKAPDERYPTCGELMTATREALQGMPTVLAPPRTPAAPPASTAGAREHPTRQGGAAPTVEHLDDRPTAARASAPRSDVPAVRRRPPWRRPLVLSGLAAAAIVAVIALAVVLGGGDGGAADGGAADTGTGSPRVVGSPLKVGRRPFGVAIGPGVLWVANNDDDSVTRIATDGNPRTDIVVEKQPFGLTQAGPAFWVANRGSDSVIRIDIPTGKPGKPIPVGDEPFFLTADENSVFVANGGDGDGTITVIDARSGKVAGDPIRVGGRLRGIVFSGSAVWVVDNRAETVKRIVNGRVTRTIPVGANPVEIAFGNNALWVTNKNDDTVSRIDLRGQGAQEKTIRVGRQPHGIAFGEGFAWVTNSKSNNVMRLDPKTGEVVGDPIPIPGQPVGIDARDGQVWVTANDAGTVTQIDPG
jgi:serine/threonine protein kinase/streptogramin lyase